MSTEQMRQQLMKAYPSDSWRAKVKAFPDAQVVAVYNRLKTQNKI